MTYHDDATVEHLLAVAELVKRGREVGMPDPRYVRTGPNGLGMDFDSLEALTDWALWLEAPIAESPVFGVPPLTAQFRATAEIGDGGYDLDLSWYERASEQVSA